MPKKKSTTPELPSMKELLIEVKELIVAYTPKEVQGCVSFFWNWFGVAFVFNLKILQLVWPFLKFTGLWIPLAILWIGSVLQSVGMPAMLWELPFFLALCYVPYQTKQSIKHRKEKKQEVVARPAVDGVFFGQVTEGGWWSQKKEYVYRPLHKDGHVLVVGGSGSGKSSCIVVPTLRDTWDAAALVLDIKGDLYEKSSRPNAYVFNPLKEDAAGYDPFCMARGNETPYNVLNEIALALIPLPHNTKEPFWIQAAQGVLTAHLVYCYKREKTFTESLSILLKTPPKVLMNINSQDEDAAYYLTQYMGLKEEQLSSITSQIASNITVFATDPAIQSMVTRKTLITPHLLEEGYDIFLQIPESKLKTWKPLVSLIIQQFAAYFEQRPDGNDAPILFVLDEFPRLGKLDVVINGLATLRSKKVTIMPVVQSLAQLDAIYGHDERKVIADNCQYKAILNATDADSQEYFSRIVGTYEKQKVTRSSGGSGSSTSVTTEDKRVIKPEDFAYLEDELVLLTPYGWSRVEKRPYYVYDEPLNVVQVSETSTQEERASSAQVVQVSQTEPAGDDDYEQDQGIFSRFLNKLQTSFMDEEIVSEEEQPEQVQHLSDEEICKKYDLALRRAHQFAQEGATRDEVLQCFIETLTQEEQAEYRRYGEIRERQQQERERRKKEEQQRQLSAQAINEKYDALLEQKVQAAPAGTPVDQIVMQYFTTLAPQEQAEFGKDWTRRQFERMQQQQAKQQVNGASPTGKDQKATSTEPSQEEVRAVEKDKQVERSEGRIQKQEEGVPATTSVGGNGKQPANQTPEDVKQYIQQLQAVKGRTNRASEEFYGEVVKKKAGAK